MLRTFGMVLLFFGFISIMSCGDEDCKEETLTLSSLEDEYGCVNTRYQMDITLNNQFTIIRDQSAFDTLVSGSCMPQIDFGQYDLIIGKQGLTSGNTSIDYEMEKVCDPEVYQLTVTFNQNATTEAPNLTFHTMTPKLDEEINVEVTVEQIF